MKKVLGVFVIFCLLLSCSKDDNNSKTTLTYGMTIEKVCGGTRVDYCITKATYDYLESLPFTGDPCNWVSVKDIDGKSVSGYLRSFGIPCSK